MKAKQILEQVNSQNNNTNFTLGTGTFQGISINGQEWTPPKPKVSAITKVKIFGIHLWDKVQEISVDEFFNRLGKSKKELKIIDGIIDKYLKQISKAEKMGQTALVEKMKDDIEVVKKETSAVLCGVKSYLTSYQIDKLLSNQVKILNLPL